MDSEVQLNRTLKEMETYYARMNDMRISERCSCGLVTIKNEPDQHSCTTCGEVLECPSCNDHEYNKAPSIKDEIEINNQVKDYVHRQKWGRE